MKLSLLSENLQRKLSFANHAVSNKSHLPILLNFLIEAKKGSLNIKSTDLEIGISVDVPAVVEKEGITTIPAKPFLELVSVIPPGKMSLTLNKEGLELKTEKIKTIFQVATPSEFPKLYENIGEETINIEKEIVKILFGKVIFAASQDATRPALSGILIKKEKEKLWVVSTDGYRLSLKEYVFERKQSIDEDFSVIVPARVIRELLLMGKNEADIKLFASKQNNQAVFLQNGTVLVGRLIEAEFPEYGKIIPTSFLTKISFDRQDMQNAVKTCYIFAKETAGIVKISIKKDKTIVSSSTPMVGENSVEVDTKTTGEENEIAFNGRYLLDLFSNIEEEDMYFEMGSSLNPGVFKITKEPSFLHLIMPIRIQQES